jgi:hypothetical protein
VEMKIANLNIASSALLKAFSLDNSILAVDSIENQMGNSLLIWQAEFI